LVARATEIETATETVTETETETETETATATETQTETETATETQTETDILTTSEEADLVRETLSKLRHIRHQPQGCALKPRRPPARKPHAPVREHPSPDARVTRDM